MCAHRFEHPFLSDSWEFWCVGSTKRNVSFWSNRKPSSGYRVSRITQNSKCNKASPYYQIIHPVHRNINNQVFPVCTWMHYRIMIEVKLKLTTRIFILCKSSQGEVLECLWFTQQSVIILLLFLWDFVEARKKQERCSSERTAMGERDIFSPD